MIRVGAKRVMLAALCASLTLLFIGLGIWQVERRAWKLDLIDRVDSRIHASPVPAPADWAHFDGPANEYRRVEATGTFRNDRETRVDALTERGPGSWLLTPLVTPFGTIIVNRGFVAQGAAVAARPAGAVTVRGLVRLSEPGGRVLRPNRPAADRWYSRDVAAIARARRLGPVAPYFIDAGAAPGSAGAPIGGMTVVTFRNAHLAYALTWFALALLSAAGLVIAIRDPHKRA